LGIRPKSFKITSQTLNTEASSIVRVRNADMTSFNKVYYSECVLERINAMRMREENAIRCRDYLTPLVDATYRKLMVDWCFNVADAFALSRNTVGAAVSIFDRYVSSGNGLSHEALKSTKKFQLAVVASFFGDETSRTGAFGTGDYLFRRCDETPRTRTVYNRDAVAREVVPGSQRRK
jgi:hypothetical protein